MDKQIIEVSWSEYINKIEDLVLVINAGCLNFDQVIGIATGGLIPATIIAKKLKKPLAVLHAKSYCPAFDGSIPEIKKEVVFGQELSTIDGCVGNAVLIVDDLDDSGDTLSRAMSWIRTHHPHIFNIITAVIWHKAVSNFIPDIYVEYVPADENGECPWILQPFEPET